MHKALVSNCQQDHPLHNYNTATINIFRFGYI